MKTLVFSDLHLGPRIEPRKLEFLKKLISSVDQVVINGDFWDGYLQSFDSFVSSKWSELFPLLLEKKTVYIYGNHDRPEFSDKRVSLFSTQHVTRYTLHDDGKTFHIEHGNLPLPSIDDALKLGRKTASFLTVYYTAFERFITRLTRNTSRPWGILLNMKLKKYINDKSGIYLFGHTHYAEFDVKHNFVNSGFVQHGLAQYLIIEDGKITPKAEWYE